MIINKVNRVWFKKSFLDNIRHSVNNAQIPVKIVYPLESKKLLQVKGNDAAVFLQGLITNDMRHFDEGANSIYAMFLNNRGRVLYDTLIHKWDDGESFLIECDKNIINSLSKHLKLFKLRRLIDIKDVTSSFKIWAMITPPNFVFNRVVDSRNSINLFKDPRLPDLGFRMLTPPTIEETEIADVIGDDIKIESKEDGYKYFRYKLGVSEGAEDLQPGSNFPLEVNCDYLHGVSFHKGCYIGQELTARVHHTGVVRKRIMPLKFSEKVTTDLEVDSIITSNDNPKSNLGKVKGYLGDQGIGLVRIKDVIEKKQLNVSNYTVTVEKPSWWPIEAPKEISAAKLE